MDIPYDNGGFGLVEDDGAVGDINEDEWEIFY